MNNELFFFFFTAKWDQCMQVLLAGTAARVPTSSSDGKRKTKKKKTKWSSHRTESSPISCWDDFTEAGQRRPKSQPHCDCRGAPTTHNPLQLFLFFNQWHGWKKKRKKDVWHQPCMLYFNTMWCMTVRRKEKNKKTKRKQKSNFQCIASRVFWLCAARRGQAGPVFVSSSSSF